MRLLLIGAPGAGKGTQAVRVAEHFGLTHISSGDLLRRHIAEETSIGRSVGAAMHRGDLVTDGIVMDVLRKPVEAASRNGGYVLDGFPRTVEQAEVAYLVARDIGASVQVAVFLDVPRPELVHRLLERGRAANRTDDTEDVITRRLRVFEEHTLPLLDYYRQREQLLKIDGARSVDEVTAALVAELEAVRHLLDG
ncbi:adenylate kinase [Plantactinospora sp. KBS50]|uniref:adenylate kinase n=1 Tax=Plantactinospora sp. KBS50 TaxID=2024580 RepID=UPI000BAB1F25|nr:adenylate kinase [Plantactinospora sp. KBS50]ASW54972.1 adenylate kinase [Plantactinospora sp. KBS50]